jgi:hypothetical protein
MDPYSPYNNEEGMDIEENFLHGNQGNFPVFYLCFWAVFCCCSYNFYLAQISR